MLRIIRTLANSLAVLIVAGAIAPITAHALPLGNGLHLYAAGTQKNVTFQLKNKGDAALEVKVAGQLYTVAPHGGIKISVPEGSDICAANDSAKHHSGDVLFKVTKEINGNILWIG